LIGKINASSFKSDMILSIPSSQQIRRTEAGYAGKHEACEYEAGKPLTVFDGIEVDLGGLVRGGQ
jgi:hypothetical protein